LRGAMLRSGLFLAIAAGMVVASAAMAQGAGYDQRVAHACASMGLNPSEAPFVYCELSLQEHAVSAARPRDVALARRACSRAGYRVRSASFGNCVLDREQSASPPPASDVSGDEPFRSYQRADEMTSVRRACAQVGLVPSSQQYATCVGDLDMTIDDANRVGTD
jgi:hypothetical protein